MVRNGNVIARKGDHTLRSHSPTMASISQRQP